MLLLFVPIYNCENFQLEGVVLIVLAGSSEGFIHYMIAKLFGPLIWVGVLRLGMLDRGRAGLASHPQGRSPASGLNNSDG